MSPCHLYPTIRPSNHPTIYYSLPQSTAVFSTSYKKNSFLANKFHTTFTRCVNSSNTCTNVVTHRYQCGIPPMQNIVSKLSPPTITSRARCSAAPDIITQRLFFSTWAPRAGVHSKHVAANGRWRTMAGLATRVPREWDLPPDFVLART